MMKKPFVILLGAMTALSMSTFAPASADDSSYKTSVNSGNAFNVMFTLNDEIHDVLPLINKIDRSGDYNKVFPGKNEKYESVDKTTDEVTVYYSDSLKDAIGNIPLHLDASMQIPAQLSKYTYFYDNRRFLADAPNFTELTFNMDPRVEYYKDTNITFSSPIWAPQAIYQGGTDSVLQITGNTLTKDSLSAADPNTKGVANFKDFKYQANIVNSIQAKSPDTSFETTMDTINSTKNKNFSVFSALRKSLNDSTKDEYYLGDTYLGNDFFEKPKSTWTTITTKDKKPFVYISPSEAVTIAIGNDKPLEFSGAIKVQPAIKSPVTKDIGLYKFEKDKKYYLNEACGFIGCIPAVAPVDTSTPQPRKIESRILKVKFLLPTVTFDHHGGNGSNEVVQVAGSIAENSQFPGIAGQVFPKNPVFPGHTFKGWYTADGKKFDATTPVYKPITVYAVWDHAQAPGTVENVNRVGGPDRVATSLNLWRRTANRHVMVLAGTTGVPDAFTGGPFAALEGTTVVFTDKNHLSDSVVKAIKQNNVNKVFVLGGTGVVSDNVKNELKALGLEVVRIDGANRYATASAIADYIATLRGRTSGDLPVVLATGENFADSLVASPLAHKVKGAVLLTEGNKLGQVTEDYLKKSGNQIITVGNPATVAANNSVFKTRVIKSWVGKDRYSTAATVLKQEFPKAWHVAIVNGQSPADGAIAGGYISYLNGAVLFTRTDSLPAATRSVLRAGMRLEVVGGTARISPRVFQQLQIAVD